VSFDPQAPALAPRLAGLSRRLAHFGIEDMVALETATFDSPFDGKVPVDNSTDAYHDIAAHADTLEPLLPGERSPRPDNDGPRSILFMPDAEGGDPAGTAASGLVAAVVYPFRRLAPAGDSLTWYQLLPHGRERVTLRVYSCFPREVLDDPARREAISGLQDITRRVHLLHIEAWEATWAGLRPRSRRAGRLAPLEKPIWQFSHGWIERMGRAC
jgi:hypothetical protein